MRLGTMLFAAPHRGMFLTGLIQGLAAMGFWFFDLGARYLGLWPVPPWPLPSPWLHGLLMGYGVFGPFIFGFILTAGPRWQQQADAPAALFRPAVVMTLAGWLLSDLGLVVWWLLPLGLLVVSGGWWLATGFVWQLFARSPGGRLHIGLVAAALSAGAIGLAGFGLLAAGGPSWLGPLSIGLALWLYLVPVFVVVIHRMLPFFSQSVIPGFPARRPLWPLALLLAGSLLHGVLHFFSLASLSWIADASAAVAAFRLTLLWRLRDSFAARILAVLHVAFAWAGIAFGLFAVDGLLVLATLPGLGLAPLHALTVGFFSSTLLGMASRVTLGHSGRPIVGDGVMWASFWAMQVATLLRIGGEFWPGLLNPLAASLWLLAFAAWAWRYGPALWRPRVDGQPG